MKLWMDVMRDLESVMDDHERILDAWAEGGVDGVVFGPLVFGTNQLLQGARPVESGQKVAMAYDPNPAVYERLGVEAPPPPEHPLPEKRALLEKTMMAARDRGMEVYIMYADAGAGPGGDGYHLHDDRTLASRVARMVDTLEHFPMADGAVMDGPEWGYEIAPHHMNYRSYIFNDLPEDLAPMAADLGYDYEAMVAARDRLLSLFHGLDPARIRLHAQGGLVGSFQLFGGDPDLMAWMSFRVASLTRYFQRIREGLAAELERPTKLGCGPRSAAFAPLCGYDFAQLAGFMDFLLPKHYFFHRGFDGFIGTVHRYCETLCEWNPHLTVREALDVVQALFGILLPGVEEMVDFESALSPEFFAQVVTLETRRALAAVDDPERIVPWLDTGRFPHDGDPMSARDLRLLLDTAEDAGLRRFNYHHQGNLSAGEWVVISDKCGVRWDPRTSPYEPPDQLVL
ncbi:MAG: hypothetical protein HOC74_00970 [Gemmatimonadetes bacterium]|jgi:hypothetical protein|nr:hypothetical protein [Gemmatimonadota bacterium]